MTKKPNTGPQRAPAKSSAPPRVLLLTVQALGDAVGEATLARFGDKPIWFALAADVDRLGISLFDQVPEPKTTREVEEIMNATADASFSSFTDDELAELADWYDYRGEIEAGFHASATLAQARQHFEKDGYQVISLSTLS
jgi:hypothetical protein